MTASLPPRCDGSHSAPSQRRIVRSSAARLRPTPAKCSAPGRAALQPMHSSLARLGVRGKRWLYADALLRHFSRRALRSMLWECACTRPAPLSPLCGGPNGVTRALFMFRGRNTPRVRPASPGSLSTVRAPVSRAHRQRALVPLLHSPCLGPGVRRSRFVLCCGTYTRPPRSSGLLLLHHSATVRG